jgi:hypothetical protein
LKKQIYIILYILGYSLLFIPASAQEEDRLIRFKAVFVYYFIDYIRWPATESSEPFKIGFLGNSPLEEPLKEIANKRKVGKRNVQIQTYDTIKDLGTCDLVFITQTKKNLVNELAKHVNNQNTLTISDTPDLGKQGIAINMVLVNGKLKFEINRQALKNANLKASSQLLKLAILVDSTD